jgi:hypothetical protein
MYRSEHSKYFEKTNFPNSVILDTCNTVLHLYVIQRQRVKFSMYCEHKAKCKLSDQVDQGLIFNPLCSADKDSTYC